MKRQCLAASWIGLAAFAPLASGQTDYEALYNEVSSNASFNVEVMRGFCISADQTGQADEAFAIHSYQSSVVCFDLPKNPSGVLQAKDRWRTVTDPVSIAITDTHVYVLGQGSHALAKHDRQTGEIVDVLMLSGESLDAPNDELGQRLGTEPSDLVLLEDPSGEDKAYISLMGADAVIEVGLDSPMEIEFRWEADTNGSTDDFQLKRPRFLNLDAAKGHLYVAPNMSGNNTFGVRDQDPNPPAVGIDGFDEVTGLDTDLIHSGYKFPNFQLVNNPTFPGGGLPDYDLFRIELGSRDVYPVNRGVGSVLTAHGQHPSGQYWMLGINSLNMSAFTEPLLNGAFAQNILTKTPIGEFDLISGPPANHFDLPNYRETDLDLDGNGNYGADHSLPFPYAMALGGPKNVTAIGSSTLSRVAFLETSGARTNLDLAQPPATHGGLVIRDLQFFDERVYIYCQETSNIIVYQLDSQGLPSPSAAFSLDLGVDPSSPSIVAGRRIFYDANRSRDSRFTCATCHPGGESDLLIWDLKDGTRDFKDPMTTQTLKGLRETSPFHWRGERSLLDFNEAFEGLLGHDMNLTPTEFIAFQDFIFSLRPAANPYGRLDRRMPAAIQPQGSGTPGITLTGREAFHFRGTDSANCLECHPMPTGGNGMAHPDNRSSERAFASTNASMETIQLSNFLQHRDQALVPVLVNGPSAQTTIMRSFTGVGYRHNSAENSLMGFIQNQFSGPLSDNVDDVTAFIQASDTGTPPAAHAAVLWNIASDPALLPILVGLEDQADDGWIDLIAFGSGPDSSGQEAALSWTYNRDQDVFQADQPGVADRTLDQLTDFGQFAYLDNTFIGVPAGLGARLGRDFDADGIINGAEASATATWDQDSNDDGFLDGYPLPDGAGPVILGTPTLIADVTNASMAIVQFETDEPCTWVLKATPAPMSHALVTTQFDASRALAREHTAHIHGLQPSWAAVNPTTGMSAHGGTTTSYDLELILIDQYGNPNTMLYSIPLSTRDAASTTGGGIVVISDFNMPSPTITGSTASFQADIRIQPRSNGLLPSMTTAGDFILLAQVQVRDPLTGHWSAVKDADMPMSTATNRVGGVTNPVEVEAGGSTSPNTPLTVMRGRVEYISMVGQRLSTLFALPATDNMGWTSLSFDVANVVAGEAYALRVLGIAKAPTNPQYVMATPYFPSLLAFTAWSMPETEPTLRAAVQDI